MAVYDRRYGPFEGRLTPRRWRFLVLPAYSYKEIFASKAFIVFLALWGVWSLLVLPILIYLPHNLGALEALQIDPEALAPIFEVTATKAFGFFMFPALIIAYLTALVLGPALVSADLRNNGLPLYLSRPFSRAEYLLGKTTVLIVLLSAVSWVPGLFLFFFQASLGGWSWLREHYHVGLAIFLSHWIWILVLCLLGLAISAYVKWKPVARVALLAVWFVAAALGGLFNVLFKTQWGSLINIGDMVSVVWASLFRIDSPVSVPAGAAWLALLAVCAVCVWMLARKVRAYEVVRS